MFRDKQRFPLSSVQNPFRQITSFSDDQKSNQKYSSTSCKSQPPVFILEFPLTSAYAFSTNETRNVSVTIIVWYCSFNWIYEEQLGDSLKQIWGSSSCGNMLLQISGSSFETISRHGSDQIGWIETVFCKYIITLNISTISLFFNRTGEKKETSCFFFKNFYALVE